MRGEKNAGLHEEVGDETELKKQNKGPKFCVKVKNTGAVTERGGLFVQGSRPAVSTLSPSLPSHIRPLTSDLARHRKHQHRILTLFCMPTIHTHTRAHTHR